MTSTPEEIACALVEDFWEKGGECTREYAQEKIATAIRASRAQEREVILNLLRENVNDVVAEILRKYSGEAR